LTTYLSFYFLPNFLFSFYFFSIYFISFLWHWLIKFQSRRQPRRNVLWNIYVYTYLLAIHFIWSSSLFNILIWLLAFFAALCDMEKLSFFALSMIKKDEYFIQLFWLNSSREKAQEKKYNYLIRKIMFCLLFSESRMPNVIMIMAVVRQMCRMATPPTDRCVIVIYVMYRQNTCESLIDAVAWLLNLIKIHVIYYLAQQTTTRYTPIIIMIIIVIIIVGIMWWRDEEQAKHTQEYNVTIFETSLPQDADQILGLVHYDERKIKTEREIWQMKINWGSNIWDFHVVPSLCYK
jgi:hypothetical protein